MPNVPLRQSIIERLDREKEAKQKRTGVKVTYSDVVLGLFEKAGGD